MGSAIVHILHVIPRAGVEMKYSNGGKPYARFGVPVDIGRKGEDKTQWWNVSLLGESAEQAAQHLRPGAVISLPVQQVEADVYNGKATLSGVAFGFDIVSWGPKDGESASITPASKSVTVASTPASATLDEDIPF